MGEEGFESDFERGRGREALRTAAELYHQELFSPRGRQALEYLTKRRGFNETALREFKVGLAPKSSRFLIQKLHEDEGFLLQTLYTVGLLGRKMREGSDGQLFPIYYDFYFDTDRVTFPFLRFDGQVLGFTARRLDGSNERKYINTRETPIFSKGKTLYNYDNALRAARETGKIYIVEGPTSIIQASQLGMNNIAATCGTALTKDHMELIGRNGSELEIIFGFDGDEAGNLAAERTLEEVTGYDAKIYLMPEGEDPDDLMKSWRMPLDKITQYRVVSGFDFLFSRKSEGLNLGTVEDRSKLLTRFKKSWANIPQNKKSLYAEALSQKLHVSRESVLAALGESSGNRPIFYSSSRKLKERLFVKALLSAGLQRQELEYYAQLGASDILSNPEAKYSFRYFLANSDVRANTAVLHTDMFHSGSWDKLHNGIKNLASAENQQVDGEALQALFDGIHEPVNAERQISHSGLENLFFEIMIDESSRIMRIEYSRKDISLKGISQAILKKIRGNHGDRNS